MSEDGHKYFFGQMPEMPYKKKEREMDNEFKKLVLRFLAAILLLVYYEINGQVLGEENIDYQSIVDLGKETNEYIRKLG